MNRNVNQLQQESLVAVRSIYMYRGLPVHVYLYEVLSAFMRVIIIGVSIVNDHSAFMCVIVRGLPLPFQSRVWSDTATEGCQ